MSTPYYSDDLASVSRRPARRVIITNPAIGLTRNEQLKAGGNGVVPPQAYAALSMLVPISELRDAS